MMNPLQRNFNEISNHNKLFYLFEYYNDRLYNNFRFCTTL